ncbi:MAG: PepSY domain-containing protein [Nevskiales bacterium]|nr:PepSY domain-containing protein [Nevskiales bacterium]
MLRSLLIRGLCIASLCSSLPALALGPDAPLRRLPPSRQEAPLRQPDLQTLNPRLTPSQAARQVQQEYGGRILAVQPAGAGYRVKVLKDGEVRTYIVDP